MWLDKINYIIMQTILEGETPPPEQDKIAEAAKAINWFYIWIGFTVFIYLLELLLKCR